MYLTACPNLIWNLDAKHHRLGRVNVNCRIRIPTSSTMGKRGREDFDETVSNKRLHVDAIDRLSALSDELLLVLLSYLPERDLIHCESYVSYGVAKVPSLIL